MRARGVSFDYDGERRLETLYVATVHHLSPRWIDVQLGYLRRHLTEPYRVFAAVEGVDRSYEQRFDTVVPAVGSHAGKLNLLAAVIGAEARRDDLILFLDGDAFPIADPMPTIRDGLERTALVAIRRDENDGDTQPHPSFAATTVDTWRSINGDWSAGHPWVGRSGKSTSDVGGNLLRLLELAGASWQPVRRSNTRELHPLWFGVYGGVVYHHGAGFRPPISRADAAEAPRRHTADFPGLRGPSRKLNSWRDRRWRERRQAIAKAMSDRVYAQIRSDPTFHQQFLGANPSSSSSA